MKLYTLFQLPTVYTEYVCRVNVCMYVRYYKFHQYSMNCQMRKRDITFNRYSCQNYRKKHKRSHRFVLNWTYANENYGDCSAIVRSYVTINKIMGADLLDMSTQKYQRILEFCEQSQLH